jgi:KDO2-lipid IV(A) lauroyltransferase
MGERKDRWHRLRRRIRFLFLQALILPLSYLPRRVALAVFGQIGRLALALSPPARAAILENARLIFPDWSAPARAAFAGDVARALGRNLFDFVALRRYSLETIARLVSIHGIERLEQVRRPGVGVVCLSAHLGCWELIPFRLRSLGYPVAVVYRRLRDASLDAYVASRRRRFGIETHERDSGARGILRSLRAGALVGILTDQHTRVDSVRVPFFGHPAWTPSGVVRLAWRTGAPVIPLVTAMEPQGTHRLMVGEPITVEPPPKAAGSAEVERALAEACERCNAGLSALILSHKEQWVWFHRRWRD